MEKLRAKWMRLVDLLKNDNAVDIFNPDSALEGALCIRLPVVIVGSGILHLGIV